MTRNKLGKMATLAWTKAGTKVPISMTILRKLTTVQGRMSDPSMAISISRQLCHRKSTTYQCYTIHDDRQEALEVYRHLRASFFKPTVTVTSAMELSTASFFSDSGLELY